MGLKTTNYNVASLGVTLDTAYAIISDLYVDKQGNAKAVFEVQQSRENALGLLPIESAEVNFTADKTGAVYPPCALSQFRREQDASASNSPHIRTCCRQCRFLLHKRSHAVNYFN